jgi:hypothetical protein
MQDLARSAQLRRRDVEIQHLFFAGCSRDIVLLLSSYVLEKKIFSFIVYGDTWSMIGGLPMEKSVVVADMRQARKTWGADSMMRSSEERSSTGGAAIRDRGGSSSTVVNLGPLLLAWIRMGVGKCSKARLCF